MTMVFKEKEVVWAKMDGYPFWPARIASESIASQLKTFREAEGIVVLFFGIELTYGVVPEENVKPFEPNFSDYSRAKSKKSIKVDFETALEQASKSETIEDPPLELNMENEESEDVDMNEVDTTEGEISNKKATDEAVAGGDAKVMIDKKSSTEDEDVKEAMMEAAAEEDMPVMKDDDGHLNKKSKLGEESSTAQKESAVDEKQILGSDGKMAEITTQKSE